MLRDFPGDLYVISEQMILANRSNKYHLTCNIVELMLLAQHHLQEWEQ